MQPEAIPQTGQSEQSSGTPPVSGVVWAPAGTPSAEISDRPHGDNASEEVTGKETTGPS